MSISRLFSWLRAKQGSYELVPPASDTLDFLKGQLEAHRLPVVGCPHCGHGSSMMAERAARLDSEWDSLRCERSECGKDFELAEAIDWAFLAGWESGYQLWARGKVVVGQVDCQPGQTALLDIHGQFASKYDVYRVWAGAQHMTFLAGGLVTKFIPQGYAMVGLAPDPDGSPGDMHNFFITVVGNAPDAPRPPEAWKRLLLEARVLGVDAPALTPILAVAGMDLFIESLNADPDYAIESEGRKPGSWNKAVEKLLGVKLSRLMGKRQFIELEKTVGLRNRVAHGREYLDILPADVRAREDRWEKKKHLYESSSLTPAGHFALRAVLTAIRSCRREAAEAP